MRARRVWRPDWWRWIQDSRGPLRHCNISLEWYLKRSLVLANSPLFSFPPERRGIVFPSSDSAFRDQILNMVSHQRMADFLPKWRPVKKQLRGEELVIIKTPQPFWAREIISFIESYSICYLMTFRCFRKLGIDRSIRRGCLDLKTHQFFV